MVGGEHSPVGPDPHFIALLFDAHRTGHLKYITPIPRKMPCKQEEIVSRMELRLILQDDCSMGLHREPYILGERRRESEAPCHVCFCRNEIAGLL